MRLVHWLLGVLFPPKCVLCGKILGKEELDLCRTCREETVGVMVGNAKKNRRYSGLKLRLQGKVK